MKIDLTKQDLENMENKLREQIAYAKAVHANTKDLTKQLELVYLAKIGYSQVLD